MDLSQGAMAQQAVSANPYAVLVPIVSYRALEKAVDVLQDLVFYYFPLYDLSEADFLRFMPMLAFAEGTVYQIDEEYELQIDNPHFVSQYLMLLRQVLASLKLYDDALESEIQGGVTYWRLEQQLCSGAPFTEADIVRANGYRCGDYRFLHRILFKLMARPYDEELLDLCSLVEQMGEIEEDLLQYQEDIQRNAFNTYRMFVRLYGPTAPQHVQRYLDTLEQQAEQRFHQLAAARPDLAAIWHELQDAYYTDHPTPAIPPPILEPGERSMPQPVDTASSNDLFVPAISYRAFEKAARTLTDIVGFYFPLHGLSPADFPRFMTILLFVEGTIYQIDEEYEAHVDDVQFVSPSMAVLRNVLTSLDLYDAALETELQHGLEYYRLEQQLCSGAPFTEADVGQASRFKCFDCRFLHRLLHRLLAKPYDEELLDLCWLVEQAADIEEDLLHYQEDVQRNVYNTYRMFVRLYAAAAPQYMQHHLDAFEQAAQPRLVQLAQTRPDTAALVEQLYAAGRALYPMPAIPEPILE